MSASVPSGSTAALAAAEALPFGVATTDPQGRITWANAAYSQLTGYTPAELLGRSAGDLPWHALAQAAPSPEPWRTQLTCRRRTGESCHIDHSVTPVRDAAGQVTAFWMMTGGPTELERDGTWPHHAEANLRALIESTDDLIMSVDLNFGLQTFNNALRENIASYGVKARVGMRPQDWLPPERAALWPPMFHRVLSEGPFRIEYSLLNGRTLELSFNPIRQDGKTVGISVFGKDITEQKRARKDARAIDERYNALLDRSLEWVYLCDLEGHFLDANRAALDGLGYVRDDVKNLDFQSLLTEDQLPLAYQVLAEVRETGYQQKIVEFRVRHRDGHFVPVETTASLLYEGDHPYAVQGIGRNITERKHAEEKLRENEERYRRIIATSMDGFWLTDTSGHLLEANEAYCRMSGYSISELEGMHISELETADITEHLHQTIEHGEDRFESRHRRKDGTTFDVEISVQYRASHGGQLVGFLRDITGRRRSEEALRESRAVLNAVLNAIPVRVFWKNLDLLYVGCNTPFARDAGFTDAGDIIGKGDDAASWREQAEKYRADDRAVIESGVGKLLFEEMQTTPSGKRIHLLTSKVPLRDSGGATIGVLGTYQDITERKLAEEESKRLQLQLAQAQKMESVGRLAGGVAHDFNNLLTIINGYSGMLLRKLPALDPLHNYVLEIKNAGERAASLTRQLLAFSRKQMIEPRVLDLNAAIRDSAPMLQRMIGEDVVLETCLDAARPRTMADPDQVQQVIMNLAVNARDAMPHGGRLWIGTVDVELRAGTLAARHPDAAPGQYVLITVSDTGHGMDEAIRQHIFEPFFTTKELGKGTGLGLSMVYGIIRQAGGWIEVSSEPGVGTSFRVYFPSVDLPHPAAQAEIRAATEGGVETILVVEDESGVRAFTMAALIEQGYRVLEAASGEDALQVAHRHSGQIHLLLTDVVMPGMNGVTLSRKMKEMRPDLKVLFTSGYSGQALTHPGLADSGIELLRKPFSPDELAAKVREALAARS